MTFIETLRDYEVRGLLYSQVHPTLPLIIWNYTPETQYSGIYWDEVTLQCRGLVTDIDGNIIAKGFSKFFNIEEEKHEATDDFEVFEKLDGSLILVFWYAGQMIVASRGSFTSPYALEAKRLLNEKYPNFETAISQYHTYCFELIGFEQIVVSYPESDLVLTACFHTQSSAEMSFSKDVCKILDEVLNIKYVKKYSGLDYKNIKQLNWQNSEGFVVRFSNSQRCKIKFENYLELHRIMTNQTTGQIWRALANGQPVSSILENTPDEFYDKIHAYERELKDKFTEIEELSKIYFDYFKPLLDFRRKLFIEKVNLLLVEPYCSIVKSMIDSKYYDELIWRYLEPEKSVKI